MSECKVCPAFEDCVFGRGGLGCDFEREKRNLPKITIPSASLTQAEIPEMKPIISQIVGKMHTEYENGVMKAVQSCGFDVDKERLAQALNDAQKFYTEGYHDAMVNHDVVKVMRCKDCFCFEDGMVGWCNHWQTGTDGTGYCSYGERRSE